MTRLWEHFVFFFVVLLPWKLLRWSQLATTPGHCYSLPDLLEEVRDEDGEGGHGEGHVAEDPREGARRRVEAERRRRGVLHRALDRRRI